MIPICPAPRQPSRPKVPTPPKACDTHAHVFGPGAHFPYAEDRSYTPPDAPLEKYLAMLDTLGFERGALVQGSAHGRDNSAMLDALARNPDCLRGVAVADESVPAAELRRFASLGVRALRFNHFFRGGQLHYRGGVPLTAAQALAPLMKQLGWHLQLWIDVKDLPDTIPILKSIGVPDAMSISIMPPATRMQSNFFMRVSSLAVASYYWRRVILASVRAWLTCPTQA